MSAKTTDAKEQMKNKGLPRVWRHHWSGVWIGYLLGASDLPGHLRFEGRRVWSWGGGRLECSELARDGVREGDRLGVWTTLDIALDGSVELLPTSTERCEHARGLP